MSFAPLQSDSSYAYAVNTLDLASFAIDFAPGRKAVSTCSAKSRTHSRIALNSPGIQFKLSFHQLPRQQAH